MENLLFSLLQGPLGSMGVSDADLNTYIGQCIGYVYAILAVLVIAIVVIVVASLKAKKGLKLPINLTACVACVLALLIIVNMICFGPLKSVLDTQLTPKLTLSAETTDASKAVIEQIGEEGMVLVENNGLLPLSSDVKNLNVFGWDSTNPIYGGTGSGSSDSSGNIGILDSLKNAGFSTNESLTKMYTDYAAGRPTSGGLGIGGANWTLPEPTAEYYTDALMSEATGFSDVAVIVLGRSGGEGADLPTDMYKLITDPEGFNIASEMMSAEGKGNSSYAYFASSYTNNSTSYNDFDPGEHYLEPSNTEEAMIDIVCKNFDKVVLVINANNAMELGWVADYPQIGAVILAPGTGATGFNALGKILNGSVNPSGRTVDTYVADLTATPTFNNIGNHSFTNVDDLRQALAQADGAYEGNLSFVNYVEGIYVGYKFYETAYDVRMAGFNYDKEVVYPFGYGLSYTTFTQKIEDFDASGDTVEFDVVVTNTGSVAGKDVVEVYFTPPYTEGGIEKASVNLVEFGKTKILEPGKSETISFEIPKEDFAAYDNLGVKVRGGGYVLEAGEYTVSIRSNSHTVLDSETFTVASDVTGRDSDLITATNIFEDYTAGNVTYLSRAGAFANYAEATAAPSADAYVMDAATREAVEKNSVAGYVSTDYDDPSDVMPTTGADNGLALYDLRDSDYDDPLWDDLLDQMSIDDMALLVNLGGWQTAAIPSVGKIATADCDGPAGVNNFITGNYGTGYPAEVLMAQTWNKELAAKIGDAMGQEYEDLNNFGWYGPAMNGHRSAFAGRNFEYYSEDGVLAGKFASAQVNAAAEHGVYAYIKHFFLNDQETNRCAFLLTYSNEQAMREIYAKPFEIVVKNFDFEDCKPLAVMSAFNWIGTTPACGNEDSLTTLLRNEWGFIGFVETDFNGSYGYMITEHCVRVGNDLKLGFYSNATDQITHRDSASQVLALRQASKNILYTIANSGYYANGNPATSSVDYTAKTFMPINIGVGVVLALVEAAAIYLFLKKRKAA